MATAQGFVESQSACRSINHMKSALIQVRKDGLALERVSALLRNNKPLVTTAVRNNGLALKSASPMLQSDLGVVAKACAQTVSAIKHARFMQTRDAYSAKDANIVRHIVLQAVRIDGMLLKYAPRWLRDDSRVVYAASIQNEAALKFALPSNAAASSSKDKRCANVCHFLMLVHFVGALSVALTHLIQLLARQ